MAGVRPEPASAAMDGPFYHQRTSNSSRSSLQSMQTMSVITQYSDAYNPGALPRGPLRVPQRHPRLRDGPGTYPPAYVSPEPSTATEKDVSPVQDRAVGSDRLEASPALAPESSSQGEDERGWFAHRKRSCRFLVIVGVIAVLIVALAVGLSVGLRKSPLKDGTTTSPADGLDPMFPTGSYTIRTGLKRTVPGCTSRASTWTCEPSKGGASVAMSWDIESHGPATFTVSSKDKSPVAPPFSDVSMQLVDGNQPTERLVFVLPPMDKSVEPTDGGSPTNRATRCRYQNVMLQAALYTRRRNGQSIPAPKQHGQHADWPGDVEIAQVMNSTIGQPTCQDGAGVQIADVQAAQGDCQCLYSNQG
ncbi:hypothetical protein CDD83_2286 [Cordyceps sp. RAO-2017]|nr:hypothetical protein CDD83_2286 [Cordyceps sp. RAO-2017]